MKLLIRSTLFALKLNYNKIEQGITGTTGLYNGNITEQLYRSSLDNKKRGYSYVYDRLNRLTLAALKDPDLTISSNDTPYGEKLTYDKNGNILKLTRNGASVANKVTQIDNLTYSYEAGSNKLSKVVDASGNLEGFKKGNTTTIADYTYDVFGNLTVDRNKNITKISYNSLHLPVELNIGSNKIAYLYDASGKKVQKKVIQGTSSSTTDYLNGFQYVDNVLSFIPTSEGFFDFKTNKYVYQYLDQLGNVRLSYSDKDGNNKIETAEIIEQINYYPFGLAHKGYNQKNDPLMKDFKYQYNGKENQEELGLNVYDYGARNYDAAIGRWMNVDPLAEAAPDWTPYRYGFNNPINLIDPTGMTADGWRIDEETGDKTYSEDYTKNNTPEGYTYADEILSGSEGMYYDSSGGITDEGTVLPEIEMTKKSSLHPYFNAVPSGEYGAYTPDGFGFSGSVSAFGSSLGASIVSDKYHNFDVFLSYSGAAGFNTGGITSYLPSFSATMDFYENNGSTSLLKGIPGMTKDYSAGIGYTAGYSRPEGGTGVHKLSFGGGIGARVGQSKTYSSSEIKENFKNYLKSIKL